MKKVIFTDIDGTLLDSHSPDYVKLKSLVDKILENDISLIFCSSKTKLEQDYIKSKIKLNEPYIVENGGAAIIPIDYFEKSNLMYPNTLRKNYIIKTGGSAYKIRSMLESIRTKHKIKFKGVSDLSISELSRITKLPLDYAKRMTKRKYSETVVQIQDIDICEFENIIQKEGLKVIPGSKYFDITQGNDKGTAVKILIDIYRKEYRKDVIFIGIGDSKNDEPMLSLMDLPIIVQKPNGTWQNLRINKLQKVKGVGPKGWDIALERILEY